MLYLRSVKLVNLGDKRKAKMAVECSFAADKNRYAKTYSVNVFENSGLETVYQLFVNDFHLKEDQTVFPEDGEVEPFEGDVHTWNVPPHYILGDDGKPIVDAKDEKIVSTTLTMVVVTTFGQTEESVKQSFLRSWEKHDIFVPTEED